MNARDSLLTDVATLRVRDSTELVEICFLRQGRFIHVDAVFRSATLDACDLPGVFRSRIHTDCMESVFQRGGRLARDEKIEALDIEIGHTCDDDAHFAEWPGDVTIRR